MGNLPLALAQAAAYLDETGLSAEEYLRLLDTRGAELLADEASTGYPVSLTVSWQMTFDRLAAAEDPLAFARLTRLLRTRSLARMETDSLQLHRLIQAILRARPTTEPAKPDPAVTAVRLLRAAVSPDAWDNPGAWPTWRRLLLHALTATDARRTLDGAGDDVAWLLGSAATYLMTRGEASSEPAAHRACP